MGRRKLDPDDVCRGRALRVRLAESEIPLLREVFDRHAATLWRVLGVWRSLVARSVRVGEVPSSNLGTPISPSSEELRSSDEKSGTPQVGERGLPPAPC